MTKSILTWKMITEPVQMRICVGEQKTVPLQLSLVGQQKWFAEPFEISLRESTKQYIERSKYVCWVNRKDYRPIWNKPVWVNQRNAEPLKMGLVGPQKGLRSHLK